jgi:hypothetical protein
MAIGASGLAEASSGTVGASARAPGRGAPELGKKLANGGAAQTVAATDPAESYIALAAMTPECAVHKRVTRNASRMRVNVPIKGTPTRNELWMLRV